jgi:hypothetical protein
MKHTEAPHSARDGGRPFRLLALAIMTLAPLAMGARGCDYAVVGDDCASDAGTKGKNCPSTPGCTYNGTRHATGSSFASSDGCNSCSCTSSGQVACTERACAQPCGGFTGKACPKDLYCDFASDAQCGAADQMGTCKARPQVCTDIYKPVCGCDDKTYGNACSAASAGVSVASDGECSATKGCVYGGSSHAAGETFPSSDGCNKCTCQADGNVVCTDIACSGGSVCGGLLGRSCAKGEYCNFPPDAKCGAADQTGTCSAIPNGCTKELKPVCGCDGMTYGNACTAAAAGVSVASDGACGSGGTPGCDYNGKHYAITDVFMDTTGCNTCKCGSTPGSVECTTGACGSGKVCGGRVGNTCPTGEYCYYLPAAICGTADATGSCRTTPQACDTVYAPVCGCDGNTYSNECFAATVGVSVAQNAACGTASCDYNGTKHAAGDSFPAADGCNTCKCAKDGSVTCTEALCTGKTCGGIAALTCPDPLYCNFPTSTNCGATDQSGSCMTKPQVCTAIYMPVCGCDGNTYSSECVANSVGISVKTQGACM